nr:hypothetical protein [Aminobacter aganoensis]
MADVKADKLESVRKEVEAFGCKATTVVADVSKRDEVYAAIDHAEKELGRSSTYARRHGPDLPH